MNNDQIATVVMIALIYSLGSLWMSQKMSQNDEMKKIQTIWKFVAFTSSYWIESTTIFGFKHWIKTYKRYLEFVWYRRFHSLNINIHYK